MRSTFLKLAAFSTGFVLIIASTAFADFIDFRSEENFAAAANQESFTADVGDYDLTLTPAPTGSQLYWDNVDGFGVISGTWYDEVDEIDHRESLTISFSDSVYLSSISLTDLFYENGYFEMGYYVLSDGSVETFVADFTQVKGTNGLLDIEIGADNITSISLKALPSYWIVNHDYSVMGIDVTANGASASVPELGAESSVSALALLFGGVLVVNGRRRLTRS
ncbi:MAG: hypothetical protein JXA30_09330 [Deltaproteobacteria bacterium]|nr:hypothetical protein [Deltaproteobacteria bacterium]